MDSYSHTVIKKINIIKQVKAPFCSLLSPLLIFPYQELANILNQYIILMPSLYFYHISIYR